MEASIVIGHFFNIQGLHARFPKIGLPPVIIHLSFGFSHGNQASLAWGSTHQNGNHPWCQVTKRFPKAVPRITTGESAHHNAMVAMARQSPKQQWLVALRCRCPVDVWVVTVRRWCVESQMLLAFVQDILRLFALFNFNSIALPLV